MTINLSGYKTHAIAIIMAAAAVVILAWHLLAAISPEMPPAPLTVEWSLGILGLSGVASALRNGSATDAAKAVKEIETGGETCPDLPVIVGPDADEVELRAMLTLLKALRARGVADPAALLAQIQVELSKPKV